MNWNKPEMVEIKMDAEIGSYQSDDRDSDRDHDGRPLFASGEAAIEENA